MNKKQMDYAYDFLADNNIISEEDMVLVLSLDGFNKKAFDDIAYAMEAFETFEALLEDQGCKDAIEYYKSL